LIPKPGCVRPQAASYVGADSSRTQQVEADTKLADKNKIINQARSPVDLIKRTKTEARQAKQLQFPDSNKKPMEQNTTDKTNTDIKPRSGVLGLFSRFLGR